MRILVLGGYGLIGAHVVRHLVGAGHEVLGLGRDVGMAARRMPAAGWITADLSRLTTAPAWTLLLEQVRPEAIVNCAGALQDGARDDVETVQSAAMCALWQAARAAHVQRIVQISAPRAAASADTAFMRSKGKADAALAASGLEWVVLRPGLVIAPEAYGGTALLRALAAVPLVQPLALPDAQLQTVAVDDVARAVGKAIAGEVPSGCVYDLVEDTPHSLADIVQQLRAWLGFAPVPEIVVPRPLLRLASRVADGLGWLGWRSPLRSTALVEIAAGVTGDPEPWRAATGRGLAALPDTLTRMPSTVQERWFARAFLVKPVAIASLAIFWTLTGIITLANTDAAASTLTMRGVPVAAARTVAVGGAALDIVLGLAILWRRAMPAAALGMILVTLAYLAGGTWLAPDLWADPLGPLLKAIPAMVLAVAVLAVAEDR